jgi:hypothetical protein
MQDPLSAAKRLTTFQGGPEEEEPSLRHEPGADHPLPATFTETVRAEIRSRLAAAQAPVN